MIKTNARIEKYISIKDKTTIASNTIKIKENSRVYFKYDSYNKEIRININGESHYRIKNIKDRPFITVQDGKSTRNFEDIIDYFNEFLINKKTFFYITITKSKINDKKIILIH